MAACIDPISRCAGDCNGLQQELSMENARIQHIDDSKGRGLFACRDIDESSDILMEAPLVSAQFAWNALYKYKACEYCLRSLETAEEMCRRLTANAGLDLPHPECCTVDITKYTECENCGVIYCCMDCKNAAAVRYHNLLCTNGSDEHPVNRLDEVWRNMHYPPETTNIVLIARMAAIVANATDKDPILHAFSRLCNRVSNHCDGINHKLLGEKFQEQQEMLRKMLLEAVPTSHVEQWFTPEGFRSVLAMIGTNGQGIGTSSFSEWVSNCENLSMSEDEKVDMDALIDKLYNDIDKVVGPFMDCEGSGLYLVQSSINHSCVPNAEITFPYNNHTLVVRATQPIQSGEEICISYLDECNRERSRHSRQKTLRENYLFNCTCAKCLAQADDEDVTSEEEEETQSDSMDST